MKVAIVYDRLNKWGGAERVLVAFSKLFPQATWCTSLWDLKAASFSKEWDVKASWLNHVPLLRRHHEWIPFLMPFIFEGFDFVGYDLVISISSEGAKSIITRPGTRHINYCLTPTRYLYSHKKTYLTNSIYRLVAKIMRPWDYVSAQRPDEMIAMSTSVKNRIQKYYNRESAIIFPPVDIAYFSSRSTDNSITRRYDNLAHRSTKYYLVVSRLVPYKNIKTIISAFKNSPDRHLIIVGTGSLYDELTKNLPRNISLVGQVSEYELLVYYQGAKAFIQANVEDFGLAMVEAQASGIPVIARRGGGASDIIREGVTGLLYDGQGAQALSQAIDLFESQVYLSGQCRQNAKRFDIHIWSKQMHERLSAL